jgi:phosphoribosylformylglycinamidine cyclo-ligase
MPGVYQAGDYDLAGFSVGAAERGTLLPRGDVAPGDVILGLASSGVHSNGYSLVRRLVAQAGLKWDRPAPFAPERTLGEMLLRPTRIYVRALLDALRRSSGIKAMAHITGGGLTENIPRVFEDTVAARIDLRAMPLPPVFAWLRALGNIAEAEMLRTFNCGIGMAVIVAAEAAEAVAELLRSSGETVLRIGAIETRADAAVVFDGSLIGGAV